MTLGGRLQKVSIFLIVCGFCLMSLAIFVSLSGYAVGSARYIAWALKLFAWGAIVNISGFSLMLFLSLFIFFKGDW